MAEDKTGDEAPASGSKFEVTQVQTPDSAGSLDGLDSVASIDMALSPQSPPSMDTDTITSGTTARLLPGDTQQSDEQPIISDGGIKSNDRHLYLYDEESQERPRVSTFLSSIANYNDAISTVPSTDPDAKPAPAQARLGTLAGVYLPCIQNIFGVIFFIRLVWIVGTAGCIQSFIIVFLACCVTFTTSISLSAIATNGIVPAGGSYFMISRALGPEFGGAVGILFYLATTVAAAMYIVGGVEIFLMFIAPPYFSLFGNLREDQSVMYHNFRVYGTILAIILGIMVFIGVKFVSKIAPIALICVLGALICVFVGIFLNLDGTDLEYCALGERILTTVGYTNCTKEKVNGSLYWVFCDATNNTLEGEEPQYKCDEYFEKNEATMMKAIPGINSGILFENLWSHYRYQGDYISTSEVREESISYGQNTRNMILVDITTSFTMLLAIFFPSCTGIMAGSNRSGDLADGQKAIPVGTLGAQITTSIVYLSGVVLFAAAYDRRFLLDKFGDSINGQLAVGQVAWPHPMVITIGSLLSTIGAGIQSLTGAPRLLQAIAKDDIIPILSPFRYSNSRNEPVRALLLTLCICETAILIGNLDFIAPILTMFFLMCYMFVNLACTLQSLLKTPSWRPRFKCYHWFLSLMGVVLCLVVMFLSSWYYALAAMGLASCIYKYIEFRGAEKEWGDGIRGLALSAARYSLLRLEEGPPHTKNWRPQLLVCCKLNDDLVPKYRKLFAFANQLKAGKGLTMVCSVIEGDYKKLYGEAQAAKQSLRKIMEEERVKGFTIVACSQSVSDGLGHLIQTAGLGGLRHNTVLLGWPYGWRQSPDDKAWKVFLDAAKMVVASKNALLVIKGISSFPDNNDKLSGNIDVWWIVHDGGLLMLIPFLMKQHRAWRNCKLRIFTVAHMEDNSIQMKKDIQTFLYHLRIDADVEVVEMHDTDITAYTYERTLMMEQRGELMKNMKGQQGQGRRTSVTEVQQMVQQQPKKGSCKVRFIEVPQSEELKDIKEEDAQDSIRENNTENDVSVNDDKDNDSNSPPASEISKSETESLDDVLKVKPDEANVKRMHTAVKLNEAIVSKSHNARLVVINLPGPPKTLKSGENYMEFLEVLTEGLDRVIMVRGGGREVITIYS